MAGIPDERPACDTAIVMCHKVDNRVRENVFYMDPKARSSGGERFLDTEEVGGSIPPGPTIKNNGLQPSLILWLLALLEK